MVPASSSVLSSARSVSPSIVRVQSLPLYREAEQACQQKQFQHAADLLDRLSASSELSASERAFCQQQRQLCRNHLEGKPALPAPAASAPPPSLPPSAPDCGPRALALVCRQLGQNVSVERLKALAGTNAKGTTLAGLAKAAEAVGLKAEGVQVSREGFSEVTPPAIVWANQNHYVALLALQGNGEQATATVHDPNEATEKTIPREQLLRLCSGYLLLVRK